MEIDAKEIIKFVSTDPRYKNEVDAYYESMRKLPEFDYSKFYSAYPEYASIITYTGLAI